MSDYICGNCKHYDSDMCDCEIHPKANKHDVIAEQDTCDDWADPVEVELTEQEQADIIGDRKAHEIMVEGREIE